MSVEPDAVYFAPADYAGPARRVGAFGVDFLVVVFALLASAWVGMVLCVPRDVLLMAPSPERQKQLMEHYRPLWLPWTVGALAIPLLYCIALRRLRGGTLGYRLMRVRLVDQHGEAPSWRRLGLRSLLGIVGVLPLAVTYWWCLKSARRQAFHDQWAGTWVVKKRAQPAGPALTAYQTKFLGTFALTYLDVEPYQPMAKGDRHLAAGTF